MSKRTIIFIDGANFYHSAQSLGFRVDYKKLIDYFREKTPTVVRAYYYSAIRSLPPKQSLRSLFDWLQYNGYNVVSKPVKVFSDGRIKGNMDIELTVDALQMAPHMDNMVLFSGDGDFTYLVDAVQKKGVHVTVCSTMASDPSMLADELRRQADIFVELNHIKDFISISSDHASADVYEDLEGLHEL